MHLLMVEVNAVYVVSERLDHGSHSWGKVPEGPSGEEVAVSPQGLQCQTRVLNIGSRQN